LCGRLADHQLADIGKYAIHPVTLLLAKSDPGRYHRFGAGRPACSGNAPTSGGRPEDRSIRIGIGRSDLRAVGAMLYGAFEGAQRL
jgi:hypothetical protein